MAAVSGISMAPHACEGPIGGLATLHVNAAMPNFVVQEICGQIQPGAADKVWEGANSIRSRDCDTRGGFASRRKAAGGSGEAGCIARRKRRSRSSTGRRQD
jgi:L-alanine-DL-glutamate epimerase-like enolase superfamily enzyme